MPTLTIEQYLNEIRTDLINQNSILGNFVIGTNLYIFYRAISETLARRDVRIRSAINNTSLLTAQGESLDLIGINYGITRILGNHSKGYVIGENYLGEIKKGTILETLDSKIQLVVEEDVLLSDRVSRSFKVRSVLKSSQVNLGAGTSLKSPLFPTLTLSVGRFRDDQGFAVESISGGSDIESDLDYRIRILNKLQSSFLAKGSYLTVLSALAESLPEYNIEITEDIPVPGVFTVYVDRLDSLTEQSIREIVDFHKPLGARYQIQLMSYEYIDIEVNVVGNLVSDLDVLRQQISDVVNIYFNNKSIGAPFNKSELIGNLNTQLQVVSLNIPFPLVDFIPPGNNKKIRLNNLKVTLSK